MQHEVIVYINTRNQAPNFVEQEGHSTTTCGTDDGAVFADLPLKESIAKALGSMSSYPTQHRVRNLLPPFGENCIFT